MPNSSRSAAALDREQVLAHRAAAHDLTAPGTGGVVLAVGLQDHPPGRSAALALALRTAGRAPDTDVVLVHAARGALHLHRADELPWLRAALRVDDPRDWSPQVVGPFGADLAAAGLSFGRALDEVAAAMAGVVTDGTLAKGELSSAVTPAVDPRFAPWCDTCGAAHVQDLLFRQATLHAGLVAEAGGTGGRQLRYQRALPGTPPDARTVVPGKARAELVRRFLAAFGPAAPGHLAAWLGVRPAASRRWWDLVADELGPVRVADLARWVRVSDVDRIRAAPAARGVRLLPGHDPLTELADREFLVPAPARRRTVWRSAANPGVLLVDGEIAGIWRGRVRRERLSVSVEPFAPITPAQLRAAEADIVAISAAAGATDAEITTAAPT